MKKVLFVANTDIHINLCYLPYMKYLKEHNYIVHVATNTGITFEYCDKKIEIPISRKPLKFGNISSIFKLKRVIRKEKYDLITVSTPMGSVVGRLAAKSARKNGTKVMYTAHGFHFYKGSSFISKIIYYPIEKYLMKVTDLLVTINEEDYEFALKHFHTKTKFIKGIGFQNKKFENKLSKKEQISLRKNLVISKNDYVISYIAELSNRKRQKYLIKNIKNMDLKDIKLLLVGNDTLDDKIYKLVKKFHLENKIKVLGFRNDISNILDISDLIISVSKQEGLPLNIMEAMKKEKPIIVTDCRGNRDLIKNGINGTVVPVYNFKLLKQSIVYLKENKSVAMKLGKANKDIVNEYSIEKILPQYVELYNELLDGDTYEKNLV